MTAWGAFASAAPTIAARGRDLLYRTGHGAGLLVTVRGAEPPRAHPVSVGIVDDGLYVFVLPSPKLQDLETDGRYALHAHFDPQAPDEFLIRGRMRSVPDARRQVLAAVWSWTVGQARCFELLIEDALYGERPTADDWPPRYTAWSSSELDVDRP